MRRLGWILALAACTPTQGTSTTATPMSTSSDASTSSEGTGIQTVTGHSTTVDTTATDSPTTADPTAAASSDTAVDPTTQPSTVTGEPVGECGNGIQEGVELCDDGNTDDHDSCTTLCRPPACGDGILHEGEDCDDGNTDSTDACTEECQLPVCGDKWVQAGEECDDGNDSEEDACLSNCSAASCGDGNIWAGVEVCDDGFNDDTYNGCAPGCKAFGPRCGDDVVDKININQPKGYEYCDGADPYVGVGCTDKCRYDFSQVPQMFCAGTCSWGGMAGCDKSDADVFCRLRTGNPLATAKSFTLGSPSDQGGFPCSNPGVVVEINGVDPRINLGPLPEFGVNKDVYYQPTQLKAAHSGNASSTILGATLVCQ